MHFKTFVTTLLIGGLSAPGIGQIQAPLRRVVSLEELNALVMVNNPNINVAAAAARGSNALVQSANTSPNPTLGIGASFKAASHITHGLIQICVTLDASKRPNTRK